MTTNHLELDRPPVFVCGVQRSGTTLLVKMLSRNPAIRFLPQETHLFPLYWKGGNRMRTFNNSAELAASLAADLPAVNYGWTMAPEYLESLTQDISTSNLKPKNPAELMRYVMHHWQNTLDAQLSIGEKTPAHIYYALPLLREFPEGRMVLMSRDPRAVALSEMVKLEGNDRVDRTFNAFNLIVRWSTAMQLIRRLERRPNVHFLTYEALISDPAASVRKTAEFLDINFSEDMLEVGVTNSSFSDKKQQGIGFNTANLDRWKQELAPSTIALIEYHLGEEMEAMGYKCTGIEEGLPAGSRLAKQRAKLIIARQANALSPALFHHLNRNTKYRR